MLTKEATSSHVVATSSALIKNNLYFFVIDVHIGFLLTHVDRHHLFT